MWYVLIHMYLQIKAHEFRQACAYTLDVNHQITFSNLASPPDSDQSAWFWLKMGTIQNVSWENVFKDMEHQSYVSVKQ